MSTRRTPAKSPKKRKTAAGGARNTKGETESKEPEPLPTAEWIAEMVIRILGYDLHPERQKSSRKKDRLSYLSEGFTLDAAVNNALNIYRAAQREINRLKRVPPPLPPGVTTKERTNGRVTFERGSKLITGEERRDRARRKYIIWRQWDMGQTDEWNGMPETESGFGLHQLAAAKRAYEKFFKKALACHNRQKR